MVEPNDLMEKIVSLCKRRGFVWPACEIYGGFSAAYSYGPYGAQLKKNIKDLWWKKFVEEREDIVGLDGPILLHPKVWEASGHTSGFNDAMVDCKECKKRFRADHLVKELTGKDLEGNLAAMTQALQGQECPECGKSDWTTVRLINMMFKTEMNGFDGPVYLRPETAGAIFVDFKNVGDSTRVKIPFGIAQIGKAFRNEIVARNFVFRMREFEQMEIEYFFDPEANWEELFDQWLNLQEEFYYTLGIKKENLRRFEHPQEKLSHYSKKTVDLEYNFPFGWSELSGLANRTDFDLSAHAQLSGQDLSWTDSATGRKFIPHVIEPSAGVDRALLASLLAAYTEEKINNSPLERPVSPEARLPRCSFGKAGRGGGDSAAESGCVKNGATEEIRVVLKFPAKIAPVKIAIFPLLKNKPALVEKAKNIFNELKKDFTCEFDDNGNVGKRYRRQDEIGTPFCVTVDFETIEKDDMVTVRDRDTMKQERIKTGELAEYFAEKLK
ncbi:MAG TPA: glycine--tRNA ligase [Candidatus Nanoarchaeia archaeon]|nr:glycine--tRNA ligase [Candidatus Nanoarchaeia archaeon]